MFQDRAPRNIFRKWEASLEAVGRHFETLVWNKVRSTVGGKTLFSCRRMQVLLGAELPRHLPCSGAWLVGCSMPVAAWTIACCKSLFWCNVTHYVPLDYDAVWSGRWLQTFRRNILLPGLQLSRSSRKHVPWNVCNHLPDRTVWSLKKTCNMNCETL